MSGPSREALPPRVGFGRATLRLRRLGLAVRIDARTAVLCALLLLLTALLAAAALGTGDYQLSVTEVIAALSGEARGLAHTVVVEWRLPRVLAAATFGAALGASGAIFQSLTRNPLASPDIIGFTTGSYTGALIVIIVLGGSYTQVAAGAVGGGIVTAGLVYLLAFQRGVRGFRLIIVGIGVSAMLSSVNTWLMLRADLEVAMTAAVWGAGSLNAISWEQARNGSAAIVVLLAAAMLLTRPLRQLELGDDTARALGVRAEPARLALIVLGVGLTATVTAAAGPVGFVALAAPQIARRLTRSPGTTMAPAACLGALLLLSADFLAQHALPVAIPVGVVTVVIGGAYLVWLLIHEARRRA